MSMADSSMISRCLLTMLAALLVVPAFARPASARLLAVGHGQTFASLAQAEAASQPGDTIRLDAGVYRECVVLRQPDVILEGGGQPDETTLTGVACQGKAAVVVAATHITLRNLTLTHVSVPAGNGAGIRAEGGDLVVDHVHFVANENGILAASNPQATIIIHDSVFIDNGSCVQACAHGVYLGHIGLVHIERSRFAGTKSGHHIKSRALRTEVIDCDISDGPAGTASYAIETPNGGALLVRGTNITKGLYSENHQAAISVGAEGISQPTPSILIQASVFRRDGDYPTTFVRNFSTTPAELVAITLRGNPVGVSLLSGPGSVR
jgi:hypothetical protein